MEFFQESINTEFKNSTVITIAHRITSVLNYDRIILMDKGSVIEFDSPVNLLNNKNSLFYVLAKEDGINVE